MNASRPAVHPVEAPPLTDAAVHHPRVRMKDVQGMPGTKGGLFLRLSQFMFAIISVSVMATTNDFRSATAFWYLPGLSFPLRTPMFQSFFVLAGCVLC